MLAGDVLDGPREVVPAEPQVGPPQRDGRPAAWVWALAEPCPCRPHPPRAQDLCAVAPPPTQPLGKLDGVGRSPLGGGSGRRSTAADLLQEKYSVKARGGGVQAVCHCRCTFAAVRMRSRRRWNACGHQPPPCTPPPCATQMQWQACVRRAHRACMHQPARRRLPAPPTPHCRPAGHPGERERQGGGGDCVRAGGDEPADGRPAPARQPVREASQPGGRQAGGGGRGAAAGVRLGGSAGWACMPKAAGCVPGVRLPPAGAPPLAAPARPPARPPAPALPARLPSRAARRTPSSGG